MICQRLLAFTFLGLLMFGGSAWAQSTSMMRVRLLDDQQAKKVKVQAKDGAVDVSTGNAASRLLRLERGETVTLSRRGEELHLSGDQADLFALKLQFVPSGAASFVLRGNAVSSGPTPYPGTLLVEPDPQNADALRLVNRVDLETYVASVLGSEYGLKDEEGTKAMAVAVRTYALRSNDQPQTDTYDLGDQVWSQRYEGTRGLSEATLRAARKTRGEVLTHDGALIEAAYFSSSGGHTANNEDVWEGTASSYLRGKPDPYDEAASPHIPWTERLSRDKLLRALSNTFEGRITGFVIRDRSPDGRVKTLDLLRQNSDRLRIRGPHFRHAVNRHFGYKTLLSTMFDARREGSRYVFEGKGFGHGVGLSQWGAHEMAQRGRSYEDILQFYYTGVSLTSLSEASMPPVAQAEPDAASSEEPAAPPATSSSSDSPSPETHPETELRESAPPAADSVAATPPSDASTQTALNTPSAAPPDSSARTVADTLTAPSPPKKEKAEEETKRIGW